MSKKETSLVAAPSSEALELLKKSYPVETGFDRILLPRLEFASQDKMEGSGKDKKCVVEAGTFFISKETEEKNEEGKSIWKKEEIGKEIEATIIYARKQLRYYDNNLETFTSSPVYDTDDQVVPLFCNGTKVMEGTPADLKKRYEFKDEDGKTKSKLEDNKILYVLYQGEVFQLNLRGTSMWAFKSYSLKTTLIPAQLTRFNSEAKTKGQISWNVMVFEKVRDLNAEEISDIQGRVDAIRSSIENEKAYYAKDKALEAVKIEYPKEDSGQLQIPF